MSIYSKYLWSVTVDTSNNNFGFDPGGGDDTVNITMADYGTILEVCGELEDQLIAYNAEDWVVGVSSVGIVTITNNDSDWDSHWGSTDDGLEALLGFDGTEEVQTVGSSYVLTATNQHQHGYYPGCLSWGYSTSGGAGNTNPRLWKPNWPMVRNVAGNNAQRTVGPATARETMMLSYGKIHNDEYDDTDIGLRGFWDACIASTFRFYPDREDGTVATPGTQNTDYYLCSFVRDPVTREASHPNYMTFQLELNKEPT